VRFGTDSTGCRTGADQSGGYVEVTLEQQAAQVRCYRCGSSAVQALCHHCWKPGCARHVLSSPRWANRLFGAEGRGPGLKGVRAWHCDDCRHHRTGPWLEAGVAGFALAVIGLLALPFSMVTGLSLVAIGGAIAAWAYAAIRRHSARARVRLPLPLHPRVSDVKLVERLRTHITLGADGRYQVQKYPVEGTLTATLTFGKRDADLVSAYASKHRLGPGQEVPYSAGRLVLQGPAGVAGLGDGPIIPLDGNARDIPAFRPEDPPASSPRPIALEYHLPTAPDIDSGPFWITPSITPESERHVLELDVQWTKFGPDDEKPLSLDVIELLTVTVPVTWGTVEGSSHRATLVASPEGAQEFRTIKWIQLTPSQREKEARRLTIIVRFKGKIFSEDELSGRLEATMKPALSGVEGVRMYHALGAGGAVSGTPSVKTRIEAEFTLSLASIRYQAVRVLPKRADEDRYTADFPVVPGEDAVIALTNALASSEFYVKRVTENPPRGGGRADIMHRIWDIVGRNYEGMHPVDFHLILTGEEVHGSNVRPEIGNTKIRTEIRGAYTNDAMLNRIDSVCDRIRGVTAGAMESLQPPGRGPDEG
jgi:hypothetical protein